MIRRIFTNNLKTVTKNNAVNFSNVTSLTTIENISKINNTQFDTSLKPKLYEKIMIDKGLKKYMKDIYVKSGLGFGSSLLIGGSVPILFSAVPLSAPIFIGGWFANIGLSFYSIYKMSKYKTITISKEDGLYEEINQKKEFWYKTFCVSNGLMISPLVGMTLVMNPVAIPLATVASLTTFAGASYAALKQTDTNLVKFEGPLIGCVWGLIGTGIAELIAISMGYSSLANTMDLFATIGSVGVFTALIAVDTQKAIDDYSSKELDSLKVCTELVLDITNLFIDFVKLLNRFKNDD
jgi:FtsH-binding integral membrane protein